MLKYYKMSFLKRLPEGPKENLAQEPQIFKTSPVSSCGNVEVVFSKVGIVNISFVGYGKTSDESSLFSSYL